MISTGPYSPGAHLSIIQVLFELLRELHLMGEAGLQLLVLCPLPMQPLDRLLQQCNLPTKVQDFSSTVRRSCLCHLN